MALVLVVSIEIKFYKLQICNTQKGLFGAAACAHGSVCIIQNGEGKGGGFLVVHEERTAD